MEKQVESRLKGSKQFDYHFIIFIFYIIHFYRKWLVCHFGAWNLRFYTNSFKKAT